LNAPQRAEMDVNCFQDQQARPQAALDLCQSLGEARRSNHGEMRPDDLRETVPE